MEKNKKSPNLKFGLFFIKIISVSLYSIKYKDMTKYRIVNNGYWDYLQYEDEYKFLFWTFKKWKYVLKPYYTTINYVSDDDCYINTLKDGSLEKFVKRWPNIEEYFVEANKQQKNLERIEEERQKKIEEKKKIITYL